MVATSKRPPALMNDYDSDDIFFMLSKGIFLGYFTFEHIFDNKVSLIKLCDTFEKSKSIRDTF